MFLKTVDASNILSGFDSVNIRKITDTKSNVSVTTVFSNRHSNMQLQSLMQNQRIEVTGIKFPLYLC